MISILSTFIQLFESISTLYWHVTNLFSVPINSLESLYTHMQVNIVYTWKNPLIIVCIEYSQRSYKLLDSLTIYFHCLRLIYMKGSLCLFTVYINLSALFSRLGSHRDTKLVPLLFLFYINDVVDVIKLPVYELFTDYLKVHKTAVQEKVLKWHHLQMYFCLHHNCMFYKSETIRRLHN